MPYVTLADCKRWLRRTFPSRYKVFIYVRPGAAIGKDYREAFADGDTRWFDGHDKKPYAVIRIAQSNRVGEQIETLLHEWAHVLVGHIEDWAGRGCHPPVFDAMLGDIRRAWHGESAAPAKE